MTENIYKASFRFYEAAAPYPGMCLKCGTGERLWELGMIRGTNMGAYYCDPCLIELGDFAGLMKKVVHQTEIEALEASIKTLRLQVEATPSLAKELINDLNNLFSNFVTGLAEHASAPVPVQPKANPTDPDDSTKKFGSSKGSGSAAQPAVKPSSKPASK
jgi:hypothetical protein